MLNFNYLSPYMSSCSKYMLFILYRFIQIFNWILRKYKSVYFFNYLVLLICRQSDFVRQWRDNNEIGY